MRTKQVRLVNGQTFVSKAEAQWAWLNPMPTYASPFNKACEWYSPFDRKPITSLRFGQNRYGK